MCPLTFEYALGAANDWLGTGSTTTAGTAVTNSTSWEISEAFLLHDLCILDAEIQSSYASVLRQGQALNISYSATILQSQALTGPNFTIQVMRNLARLSTVFLLFSKDDENKAKINTTQMFHPALVDGDSAVEFFMQVGGVKYPVHPIGPKDSAQLYLNLVKAAGKLGGSIESIGITLEEFLNASIDPSRKLFALSMDLEKVLEAGYSGVDTGGGKALLFDVKNMGSDVARADIIMHHEAAISIMESGVQVSF